jgi:hypothetical protein
MKQLWRIMKQHKINDVPIWTENYSTFTWIYIPNGLIVLKWVNGHLGYEPLIDQRQQAIVERHRQPYETTNEN